VEVLLAILILGIGLIMVASVFPVGANWTRQATEESVAQTIAQNAFSVIQMHYGPSGDLKGYLYPDFITAPGTLNTAGNKNTVLQNGPLSPTLLPGSAFSLQVMPGFNGVPISERTYQFGSATPFPASNPAGCTYYWTALIRLNPAYQTASPTTNNIALSSSYKYDLYILVFRKGAAEQRFTPPAVPPAGYTDITPLRDLDGMNGVDGLETLIPAVAYYNYYPGDHDPNRSPTVFNAIPSMGSYGIGAVSGTVFKQVVDANRLPTPVDFTVANTGEGGTARPSIIQTGPTTFEPIIVSPPADGTSASPLIYIYQTTLSI